MLRVVIDPGHAPGNVNGGKGGYKEHAGMWKLSNYLKSALERYGIAVELTRTENADPTLTARGLSAAGCALFISEHSNAANGVARGVECFYSVGIPGDITLAAETALIMKTANRGAKTRESTNTKGVDYYTVMSAAKRAGASHVLLIENGFHDNAADEAVLLKDENLYAIAYAQAEIIAEYLGAAKPQTPASPAAPEAPATGKVRFNLFGQKTVDITGRIIDGVSLVAARELLEEMEFAVNWNGDAQTVEVNTRATVKVTQEELTILQKIVQAEAGGEDYRGKMLVASVILNRVRDKAFPGDIKGVVFAPNQFEPTRNGAYDKAVPSAETVAAVNSVLSGLDYSQGATYFRTIKGAAGGWHETALRRLFDHGGHRFYV